jgi:hypothetical protein
MNIREISKPVTATSLNESLARRFGEKVSLDKFTLEQLQDARNKLRTKLSQVETTESFNEVHNEPYQKNKLFLDVLNAAVTERTDAEVTNETEETIVREGAEDAAELVMAAKSMVDKVTSWMEDTAEMQTESMLELADAIRDEMGSEQSEAFVNSIKPALQALYTEMEGTRATLTSGVGMLTGEEEPATTMGAEDEMADVDAEMEPTDDMEATDDAAAAEDEFAAAAPAAGGEEEAGRAKRESVEHSRKIGQILSKKK